MKKKLIIGILLGILFLYLAFKNINLSEVAESFRSVRYLYLVPIYFTMLIMQLLRAYRWKILLRPVEAVPFFPILTVTNIGFLAIMAVPARVGELVRPYLINRLTGAKMSAAIGSIVIERLFDTFSILVMLSIVAVLVPIPQWLVQSSLIVLALVLAGMAAIVALLLNRRRAGRVVGFLLAKAPPRWAKSLEGLFQHFLNGLEIMTDLRMAAAVTGLSFLIWTIGGLAVYMLFFAFGFELPLVAAFAVLVLVIAGISIPAAPGFVGNWHYFCVLALTLFSIPKPEAMAFAIIHNFLSVSLTVVLGLAFLPFARGRVIGTKTFF